MEVDGAPIDAHLDGEFAVASDGTRHPLAAVKFLPPVVPGNFYAAGLNFRAHIEWANAHLGTNYKPPTQADIGYRSNNALTGSGGEIMIPADSAGPVEYEGELVAVIGRRARNLAEKEALDCVAGYTLGNDVSERGWQRSDRTLWRAKNADTFKPMGPWILDAIDPMDQWVETRINGNTVSRYHTGGMIFGVAAYLARMSRYMTLHPGDVVWFGCDGPTTPALQPGDLVEVVNEAIGVLSNRVVRGSRTE
ncbi:MAG: fumarylacetoacetate hydrolase family protein [Betaproteobacteria bacterium]|nr:fumarylacetoacetate hydrolase family protein [Betaproteobacteria bacterium]